MNIGLVGRKEKMITFFTSEGVPCPATAIRLLPSRVVQCKSPEKDGYFAIQVGYEEVAKEKVSRAIQGHCREAGVAYRHFKEFRLDAPPTLKVGDLLSMDVKPGDRVDVTGISRGKGFTGVVKKYHFRGGKDSHGTSVVHRRPQSIGCRWPQRVIKGKRMAGRMGHLKVTLKNLLVMKVEENRLLVKGSIAGPPGEIVWIRPARGFGS